MSQCRSIQAFFDERAASWDASLPPEVVVRATEVIGALDIRPDAQVLDVGCGTGVLFPMLHTRLGPRGSLVAVDVSYLMVHQALAKTTGRPVLCLQADALNLPFAGEAFDWVICHNTFPHFTEPSRTVKELARVLARGGRLIVFHTKSREAINAFHREIGGIVHGHALPDRQTMSEFVARAGLLLRHIHELSDRYVMEARRI